MLSFGCETETATTAVVDDRSGSVVYRVWWETTYFPTPIAPDTTSDELRSVPATDFAYALLAPGWNAASTSAPTSFVVLKSKQPLSVARGETLHIAVSDATFTGSCDVHDPLSQADADFITQRIFPGEFEGLRYDAGTCTMSPLADAGGD
jgi:hypothetical protein